MLRGQLFSFPFVWLLKCTPLPIYRSFAFSSVLNGDNKGFYRTCRVDGGVITGTVKSSLEKESNEI